jgi:hypothetical protein
MQKFDHNIGFEKNDNCVAENWLKIENCDHNIDPCSSRADKVSWPTNNKLQFVRSLKIKEYQNTTNSFYLPKLFHRKAAMWR